MIRVALTFILLVAANLSVGITMDIPILNKTPNIDGKIQQEETTNASLLTTMTVMGGFQRAKDPTTVYVYATSDSSLYIAFRCADSAPDQIRTQCVKENGAVFTDDSVQVLITGDREVTKTNYVHFAVNAAGVKYSNNMGNDQPVQSWKAAATRNAGGWDAEMLIPMAAFRGSAGSPHWRVNFARYRPDRGKGDETAVWVDPGVTLHNYQRFGFVRIVNMPFPELAKAYGMDAQSLVQATRRTPAVTTSPTSLQPVLANGATTQPALSPVFTVPSTSVTTATQVGRSR